MTTQSMTDQAEIARLDGEITAACITRDMSTAYAKLQARKAVERRVAVAVAGLVLAFAPAAADAAQQTGSPATLGPAPVTHHVTTAKPASKALLAKAVSQVKVGEQRLVQTGRISAVVSLSCHGTTKQVVCSLRGVDGEMGVRFKETFVVSHGALTSVRGLVPVPTAGSASAASVLTPQHEARYISTGFRRQLSARVRVLDNTYPGMRLGSTVVRCGRSGGNTKAAFYCTGMYTITYKGLFEKYLAIIDGQSNGAWHVVGAPTKAGGDL